MSSSTLSNLVPNCRTLTAILTITLVLLNARTIRTKSIGEIDLRSRYECPPLPPTCLCTFPDSDLEVQCPIEEPRIIVRYQPGKYVQIECTTNSVDDYKHLPPMEIYDVPTAKFRRCPLPQGQSLLTMLNRLGVQHIRSLFYQSYGVDLGAPLRREYFQGLNDLERLSLNQNGLVELPADVFSDLRNLTWLDLSSNRIHLPRDIFANLDKLDFLELGYNNLQALEPGLFRNQKRLKHLNMWSNKLHNLTRGTFESVPSLTDLDLSVNHINELDADVFAPLTNLRTINLSKNNFTTLPEGLFAENKNLEQIRLMWNLVRIETLPAGLLAELPSLVTVRINTNLSMLPADMFAGSSNIVNISLASSELESLPEELFWNQTNLENLDLSRNKLVELPDEIFAYTKSLAVLNLANNKLENITSNLFAKLDMLVELYLQNNNLHHIYERAFAGTKSLRVVNAAQNKLSFKDMRFDEDVAFEIGSPFQNCMQLEVLNLHNNSIGHVFRDWIFALSNLKKLDLSNNDINMLSIADLQFRASNIEVNLAYNRIEEVDFRGITEVEFPDKPAYIKLDHNPLLCNCVILHFIQYLHKPFAEKIKDNLNIITGDLQCIGPASLKGRNATSLSAKELLCPLDVASSQIKRCPSECECMVRPVDYTLIVNCSSRSLTQVPNLPKTPEFGLQFIELHVENNNLTKLPLLSHPGYAEVSQLHARNNNISSLSPKNIPAKLHLLDLSNNSLSWINVTVFDAINRTSQLTNLSLSHNPWKCDCQARHLLSFLRTNYGRIHDLSTMKCSSGEKLSSLLSSGNLCQEDQPLLVLAYTLAVLGLLIGIFASLYYRFQMEIKVWLYAHNMCLWFVSEEELDKDKKYDAFISYSHKDEDFVTEHLLPNLENGPVPFKLCLHERDWIVGEYITNQIIRSVEDSRRTIVVLSPNFLESIWGRMEFQAAHKAALQEGRTRLIVIIYGDIGNTDNLDPELRAYLNMNTYVKWGDPWFWKKMRYAMPHPPHHDHTSSAKGLVKSALKSSTDDKLELIKPVPVTPPPLTTPPAEQACKNPLLTKLNGSLVNGNGNLPPYANGHLNGHVNGAFIINTNSKQSDV